jgi:hypothetical protein
VPGGRWLLRDLRIGQVSISVALPLLQLSCASYRRGHRAKVCVAIGVCIVSTVEMLWFIRLLRYGCTVYEVYFRN